LLRLLAVARPSHAAGTRLGRGRRRHREAPARGARRVAEREARRDLLLRGVALAATAALPASRPAQGAADRSIKVAVVGGGLAGLAAAWRLGQAGVDATVFEAAPRVGGRCWTERRAFDGGQIAERGGELIDTAHGRNHVTSRSPSVSCSIDLHAPTPRGTGPVWWIDGQRYDEAAAARDFQRVWPALAADARCSADDTPTFARHTSAQRVLDRTNAAQWLDNRVPGGSRVHWRACSPTAYMEELGADLTEISAVTVVDLLRDSPQDRVSPYEESDQRYHVPAATTSSCSAWRGARRPHRDRHAARGGRATRRRPLPPSRSRVTTRRARPNSTTSCSPSHSRCCATSTSRGPASPPRKLLAIRELGMGRNTKLQLQFEERAWIARGGSGETRIEGSYQVSWEVSRGQPGAQGILNFYSGGATATRAGDGSPRNRRAACSPTSNASIPGSSARWNGRVIRNAWDRHPWSGARTRC